MQLANGSRGFLGAFARDIAIFNGRHFDVQIDAIQQRTGDALPIPLHLKWTAAAFAFEIAKIAARTRIHRRDEHELRRKSHAPRRARHGDLPVFERLTHYFQCRSLKLG